MQDVGVKLFKYAAVVLILLLPGFYLSMKPASGLVGLPDGRDIPDQPSRQSPMAFRLDLRQPLGLLILDRSSSMTENDPKFMQTLAGEAFTYFFTHLMYEDVETRGEQGIHFATLLFSGLDGSDDTILDWGSGSPFLPVCGSGRKSDISSTVDRISKQFEASMGGPGHDLRNGGTPIFAAGVAGDALVKHYRQQFPNNDRVFAVFMTDGASEGEKAAIKTSSNALEHNNPGMSCVQVVLTNPNEATRMLPEFLAVLDMNEVQATNEFAGGGYTVSPDQRVLPIVITGSNVKPIIETDDGVKLDVRGRDGLHYALYDPRSPVCDKSRKLFMKRGGGTVTVFIKSGWTLAVEPYFLDLLAPPPHHADVVLEYTGHGTMADLGSQTIIILNSISREIGTVTATFDSVRHQYRGELPPISVFRDDPGEDFTVLWSKDGKTLSYPFKVNKRASVRLLEKASGRTSNRLEWLPRYPEQE